MASIFLLLHTSNAGINTGAILLRIYSQVVVLTPPTPPGPLNGWTSTSLWPTSSYCCTSCPLERIWKLSIPTPRHQMF